MKCPVKVTRAYTYNMHTAHNIILGSWETVSQSYRTYFSVNTSLLLLFINLFLCLNRWRFHSNFKRFWWVDLILITEKIRLAIHSIFKSRFGKKELCMLRILFCPSDVIILITRLHCTVLHCTALHSTL